METECKKVSTETCIENSPETHRISLVLGIHEAYGKTATKATVKIWNKCLEDIEIETLDRAIHKAIRTCKFMPTVAEIRESANANEVLLRDARARESVAVVEELADQYANLADDGSLEIQDPLIAETVRRLGGLPNLSKSKKGSISTWKSKEVTSIYQQVAAEHEAGGLQPRVAYARTRRIGDKTRQAKPIGELLSDLSLPGSSESVGSS